MSRAFFNCQQIVFRGVCSSTQPETRKLQQVCCRLAASCDHQADIRMRSHRLLRLDDNKSAVSCQQACCKLRTTDLLQVANCRLAASCELQTCCKLRTADLVQIVNCRLAANCELQACCKLRTADLQQVLNCRLAASCQLHIKQNHLKTQEINTLFYFISLIKLLHLSFIM